MKFVIVGYGRVGIRTARILQSEGHEVVIVDNDPVKVERATETGFETIQGDGYEEASSSTPASRRPTPSARSPPTST